MACHDLGFAASVLLSSAVSWFVAKWGVLERASSGDIGLCRDPHCRGSTQMVSCLSGDVGLCRDPHCWGSTQMVSCLIVLVWRVVGSTLILALLLTATNSVAGLRHWWKLRSF